MPNTHADIETILLRALELESRQDRDIYLAASCQGDAKLREEVEGLLRALSSAGSFLETPAGEHHPDLMTSVADQIRDTAATRQAVLASLEPSAKSNRLGVLADYEVMEVLGQGSTGVVLKAFDPQLKRVVALKVLPPHLAECPDARGRFLAEAQATAAISHEHVITIHAIDDQGSLPYLVMAYISGESLQERIDREGPLPIEETLRIGKQIASGLAAAHAEGLIHRDVKPGNILLENGVARVKLVDFGLAQAIDEAVASEDRFVAGTPQYMSPEQVDGRAVDHRSDLFSLGCVLYAMCSGRSPYHDDSTLDVLERVRTCDPIPIRELNADVSRHLAALIHNLLERLPYDRLSSAEEVSHRLGEQLAGLRSGGQASDQKDTTTEREDPMSDDNFDPYYEWLGIPPDEQPPCHYALLGLRRYESNVDVIDNATHRQMTYVRGFQLGPHGQCSQKLLNEISAARLCLLDPSSKADYDASLRESEAEYAVAPPVQVKTETAPPSRPPSGGSPRQSRNVKPGKKLWAEITKIVLGGIAGIAIAQCGLWYGFGIDALGIMSRERPREAVGAKNRERRGTLIDDSMLVLTFEDNTLQQSEGEVYMLDALGGGHNGKVVGAEPTPGLVRQAFVFDGDDDYIETSLSPRDVTTVAMWIRSVEKDGPSILLACIGRHTGYSLYPVPDDHTTFRLVYGTGSAWKSHHFKHQMLYRRWYHVVFVFDYERGEFTYYVDAIKQFSGRFEGRVDPGDKPLQLSAEGFNSFLGRMDEVAIFSRPMTSNEIAELYVRGTEQRSLVE